ncbi:MAG TPA: hypothetical protein VGV92_00350 [Gammaproteobacteria bacterium]|nr:hypothetical protein [Gammaproteobacteria bacterium]
MARIKNILIKGSAKKRLKLTDQDKEWLNFSEVGKEALKVFRDTDQKRGLRRAKDAKDMFKKLGI